MVYGTSPKTFVMPELISFLTVHLLHIYKIENRQRQWFICLSDIVAISVHFVNAEGADWNRPVWDKQEETSGYLWFCFLFKVSKKLPYIIN